MVRSFRRPLSHLQGLSSNPRVSDRSHVLRRVSGLDSLLQPYYSFGFLGYLCPLSFSTSLKFHPHNRIPPHNICFLLESHLISTLISFVSVVLSAVHSSGSPRPFALSREREILPHPPVELFSRLARTQLHQEIIETDTRASVSLQAILPRGSRL